MIFVAFKGTTMWEAQIGRVWFAVRFPRFWLTSGLGFVRLTDSDGNCES